MKESFTSSFDSDMQEYRCPRAQKGSKRFWSPSPVEGSCDSGMIASERQEANLSSLQADSRFHCTLFWCLLCRAIHGIMWSLDGRVDPDVVAKWLTARHRWWWRSAGQSWASPWNEWVMKSWWFFVIFCPFHTLTAWNEMKSSKMWYEWYPGIFLD